MNILMHMCCGPCAVYPVEVLKEDNINFKGIYYNPNIHPIDEFKRRRDNLEKLSELKDFEVMYMDDFDQSSWEDFSGEIDDRCRMCYTLRFNKVGEIAKEQGFDAFSTTLLVSPYQKHDMIIDICNDVSERVGIPFYYRDFRPGFRQGQSMAREMELYRQKYCGCIRSKEYK